MEDISFIEQEEEIQVLHFTHGLISIQQPIFMPRSVDSVFNLLPSEPVFSLVCSKSLLKTLLENVKLLIISNFFFSHSVIYRFNKRTFLHFGIVIIKLFLFGLVISVYLQWLTVAHLSRALRRWLVVTRDSERYRMKLLRIPPGSFTCSAYSTITQDHGLTSHPKDN